MCSSSHRRGSTVESRLGICGGNIVPTFGDKAWQVFDLPDAHDPLLMCDVDKWMSTAQYSMI